MEIDPSKPLNLLQFINLPLSVAANTNREDKLLSSYQQIIEFLMLTTDCEQEERE